MAQSFALQGKLGLDAKDFVSGAKQAEKAVGDVADELDELPAKGKQAGGDAGASLGGGMKSAFAAAGVGVAIGAAVKIGLDGFFAREDATKTLVGQFGKTAEEADRYGKMAGDLYAANWGESMAEVAEAIGAVDQRMVQTGQIAESAVEGITEKAMALADTFDEDVNAVVRSVSQLMLNDLAPSADVAFDLVTTGLQNGANAAGDLFDSIDEYSQHFDAFGLSAEDMMAMFTDGMANGQRDTDKMADAVKEMFIRTTDGSDATREAFDRIGLSTEEMAGKITAGGDDARQAFIDILKRINVIEDPIDRTTTGVALMGTMFEDLGPHGVDSLLAIQDGLGDVEGATQGVVDSFATTEAQLDTLKRKGKEVLSGLGNFAGEAIQDFTGMADPIDRLEDALAVLGETGPASFDAAVEAVTPYVASVEEAEMAVGIYTDSVDDATAALLKQQNPSAALVQSYIDEAIEGAKAAKETAELADEVNALGGEAGDTASAIEQLEWQYDRMRDSLSDTGMYMDVEDAFADVKASGQAAWDALQTGAEDAAELTREHERELLATKATVIDYAEKVGNIPPATLTEINALIDEGNFAEAERRIAAFEKARTTTLTVTLLQKGQLRTPSGDWAGLAAGTDHWRGGPVVVGEEGPEIVNLPRGAQVIPHAESVAMLARSVAAPTPRLAPVGGSSGFANGPGVTINHYGPNLTASDVSRGYTLARLAQIA